MRLALRDGVLLPEYSLFDFGCGRGEDVEYLKGLGFRASGWDPVHYNQGEPIAADVVNLGYVINVIEVPGERSDTLKRAFALAKRALIVSAQVGYFEEQIARSTEYQDGYLTSRNTFQKYYDQAELRDYIREALGQEPYAAGIGIYYVFCDAQLEHAYCQRLFEDTLPEAFKSGTLTLSLSAETLSAIASRVLDLGRLPEPAEAPEHGPALAILSASEGWLSRLAPYLPQERLEEIRFRRRRRLLAILLASYFSANGKLRMCDLSEAERADLRCFFGSYSRASQEVEQTLTNLTEHLEKAPTDTFDVSVIAEPEELPDLHYYLWYCIQASLSLQDAVPESYCSSTFRLCWRVEQALWTYDPGKKILQVDGDDNSTAQEFCLFSRRSASETKARRSVAPELVEAFVSWTLEQGRLPATSEFDGPKAAWTACVRQGLWEKALRESNRLERYERSRKTLWEKTLYQLGASLFQPGGRRPFKKWPESFQFDLKSLFGSYAQACAESDSWMRRMGDAQYVESEIRGASRGYQHEEKGVYFHRSLLHEQPLVVQLLVATAHQIGTVDMPRRVDVVRVSYNGDVIKFYEYEDFDSPDPTAQVAFCKVMFRKRKVYGKDYPPGARHKLLTDRRPLLGLPPAGEFFSDTRR